MFNSVFKKAERKNKPKKRKTGYGGWLFRKKIEDSDPRVIKKVKEEIKQVQDAFKNYKAKKR